HLDRVVTTTLCGGRGRAGALVGVVAGPLHADRVGVVRGRACGDAGLAERATLRIGLAVDHLVQRARQVRSQAGNDHDVARARAGARRVPLEADLDFLRVAVGVQVGEAVFKALTTTRCQADAGAAHEVAQLGAIGRYQRH